jgi:hypothetical protein
MSQEKFLEAVNKVVESVLKEKNLLTGEWHLGKVAGVISSYALSVYVNGSSTTQTIPCNPSTPFSVGDEVWVHFVNGDSTDKFVPYKRATGSEATDVIGSGGGSSGGTGSSGDMLQSLYDTNGDGIVDNSEAVNGAIVDDTQATTSNLWTASKTSSALDDKQQQIDSIMAMLYTAPTVSISTNPNVSVKEYGDNIASTILTATTVKKSKTITKVEFYRNNALINTVSSPNPNGGNETYTDATVVNDTVTYKAMVYDGQSNASSSKTITYVYPYYIGSLTNATPISSDITALTKLVKTKSNTTQAFTTTNGRFCISYPQSYGALTSILDQNNFETIGGYNLTVVNITGLNGVSVAYNVYTLATITTQTNFTNTFK